MTSKLIAGDLILIEITEHEDDPKRYAIFGTFKGSKAKIILARVGEGADDARDPEIIKMTAESVATALQRLYALFASTKARAIRDGATSADFPAFGG